MHGIRNDAAGDDRFPDSIGAALAIDQHNQIAVWNGGVVSLEVVFCVNQ